MLLNVDTPITFKVLVLTSAVLTPAIPVIPDPSPTKLVAVTTPLELICLDVISTTDILGVPVNPVAFPVTLPTKDEAVIDPLVFIVCVIAPDVSPTITSPDLVGRTTETLPEYSE